MHYIKCSNCGHFDEVKSEYLIFCSSCNKKLDNNFSDWKRKNPAGSFDDYKRLICVSEEEINAIPVKVKTRPKSLKYWIGFTVAFAIMYAVGQFGGEAIVRFIKSHITTKEIQNQEWIKESYGDFGLSVETPVKLTRSDLPLPEIVRHLIQKMDFYSYQSTSGFTIAINSTRYSPELGSVDLQGAADGAVNEMKMQMGVTDFRHTDDPFSRSDIPGIIQKGSFKKDGIEIQFINTVFSVGPVLYQIMTAYQTNDETARRAAGRVIESIEIDNGKTNNI